MSEDLGSSEGSREGSREGSSSRVCGLRLD
jgi:hypothetical protein